MDIVIRAAIVFLLVLVVTRVVGKRELASLEPFDLILLVVIGDLVQQGVTQSDYSLALAATVKHRSPDEDRHRHAEPDVCHGPAAPGPGAAMDAAIGRAERAAVPTAAQAQG